MSHKIEGQVEMDVVVLTDGRVGEVKIVKSLDSTYGLDREAMATVRRWRFKPAEKAGLPIAVTVKVQMEFRLH